MNEVTSMAAMNLKGNFHGSVFDMVAHAGFVVQLVLLLLLLFSIISWAIILMKYFSIRKIAQENDNFMNAYMKSTKLSEILPEAKKYRNSTLAEVFRAGYAELAKISRAVRGTPSGKEAAEAVGPVPEIGGVDNVERAMNRASGTETGKLESALGFLATTGSASPFIGLFGTVWGIMDTFKEIGARGSATLAVVAPGISEALIATAAGLAAAIPAVIFYTYYLNRIKGMSLEMDNFSSELLNIVERFYVKN
ncbi:MAG: protein TolQ [Deltaproteobacteria bacterium]|nr:protein TolQ [Deltaproteobacteria bacterium]